MMHPEIDYWEPDHDAANFAEQTNQLIKDIAVAHADPGEGLALLRCFWDDVYHRWGEGPYRFRFWVGSDDLLGVTVIEDGGGE